jgi:polyribonucleotide nucleotidyltransferase
VINEIIAETGVEIDIDQDGLVMITSTSSEGSDKAVKWIEDIVREIKPGDEFEGTVTRIMDFGAIVDILRGRDGMVHISELAYERVGKVEDVLNVGDKVKVKVLAVEDGRTSLSVKALLPKPEGYEERPRFDHRPPRGGGDSRGRFNNRR